MRSIHSKGERRYREGHFLRVPVGAVFTIAFVALANNICDNRNFRCHSAASCNGTERYGEDIPRAVKIRINDDYMEVAGCC